MTADQNSAVMYRSPAFRAARATLIKAEQTAPAIGIATLLYRSAFRAYRTGLEARHSVVVAPQPQEPRLAGSAPWRGGAQGAALLLGGAAGSGEDLRRGH